MPSMSWQPWSKGENFAATTKGQEKEQTQQSSMTEIWTPASSWASVLIRLFFSSIQGRIARNVILSIMQYIMKATLVYRKKETRSDGVVLDLVIWRLPTATKGRPRGLKYRLCAGCEGRTVVRYNNEAGKGDHKHIGPDEREEAYLFVSAMRLIEDFLVDVDKLGG